MPLAGASNVGKVMRGRYLGQVGRHKPCEPELFARFVPVWDRFCFATTVAVDAFGRHGATHDLSPEGVGRSGWESVMAVDWFVGTSLVRPNGSARPWVSWCG